MSTSTLTVTGMTCDGCAASVRTEIGRISGVDTVAVDLADGLVTVESATPIDRAELTAAVARAGYTVTD
ncbi:heavy metal-associated domain-containing protein [Nocardia sp. NPDC005745]|uniref:heavy-metal-associated domain-containing protein n=1 Tax=Nocardia sp. NPDC005745 TaxID=3157061 RepID=UPI0034023080